MIIALLIGLHSQLINHAGVMSLVGLTISSSDLIVSFICAHEAGS
jgi:hypothetical protein